MAALRHGVKTVILPAENEKDLAEIDQTVRRSLNFLLVEHADTVIDAALIFPQPIQTVPAKASKPAVTVPKEQQPTGKGIRQ